MTKEKRVWITIAAYAVVFLALGIYIYVQTGEVNRLTEQQRVLLASKERLTVEQQSIQSENNQMKQELDEKRAAKTPQVETDAKAFLQAYYTYNNPSGQLEKEKLIPYTTAKFQNQLSQTQNPEETDEKNSSSIQSMIDKQLVYISSQTGNQAQVFARVWQKTVVSGYGATVQNLVHLQLIYDEKQKRWLVDQITFDPPLEPEGFLDL